MMKLKQVLKMFNTAKIGGDFYKGVRKTEMTAVQ